MTAAPKAALTDTLDYLMIVSREQLQPAAARARLLDVQARHPGTSMELIWEQQAFDRSLHYDVLIRPAGGGSTVSLSYCADRGLPWPLRGVQRWSDRDLVRVNGTVLTVPDAMARLESIWADASVVHQLIDGCLLRAEVDREPERITDEELQAGMDAFRRTHRLCLARDTEDWLQRRGMTQLQLEDLVADQITIARIRDRVAAGRVESYFERHREGFDTAQVAAIDYATESDARRAYRHIGSGEADFFRAARARFESDPAERPLFRAIRRRDAIDQQTIVFGAAPGDLVGPARVADDYVLYRVLSIVPARLDDDVRAVIKRALFDEWLADKRRTATIEWNWGTAEQTG